MRLDPSGQRHAAFEVQPVDAFAVLEEQFAAINHRHDSEGHAVLDFLFVAGFERLRLLLHLRPAEVRRFGERDAIQVCSRRAGDREDAVARAVAAVSGVRIAGQSGGERRGLGQFVGQ